MLWTNIHMSRQLGVSAAGLEEFRGGSVFQGIPNSAHPPGLVGTASSTKLPFTALNLHFSALLMHILLSTGL